ncbi:Transmembrane exosortase (Exosortase_EpsH) [uncultured archaeon]|nr:Transmembrane exosortase (Exosortase_EpsH) [uncultured archaeon]
MIEQILWPALGLLIAASIIPQEKRIKFTVAGAGWALFSIHWALQWQHYIEVGDYVNVLLTVIASIGSLILGFLLLKRDRRIMGNIRGVSTINSIFMATTASAFGGLSYFAFSEINPLNQWLITMVTDQTVWLGSVFGIVITRLGTNLLSVNGHRVEIILACTAIESMALFIGIIASANASFKRMAMAFLVSVPIIYGLNLIRNVFVIDAYGMAWFGDPEMSFYIAHTIIAKAGSLVALFLIAYAVMKILPEIIDMIDGIINLFRSIFKNAG